MLTVPSGDPRDLGPRRRILARQPFEATWSPSPESRAKFRGMGHQDPPTAHAAWCFLLLIWLANSAVGYRDTALQPHSEYWRPRGGRPARSYPHLQGDVRRRRLYSSTHYFLRIGRDGKVGGTRRIECPDNIMEIRSVHAGIVAIRSVHSGFYLAMNRKGKLYGMDTANLSGLGSMLYNANNRVLCMAAFGCCAGIRAEMPAAFTIAVCWLQKAYTPSCNFEERIEENGYNTYASVLWHHKGRPMFLSLDGKGVPRKGPKTRREHLSTHFLPMLVS